MSPGRLALVSRHTGPCTHVTGKTGTGLKTYWTVHPCHREDWYWSQDILDRPPMSPGRLVLVSRHPGPSTHVTGKTGTGLKTYWTMHPCHREDWYWSQDILDRAPMSPGRLVLVSRHTGPCTHVTGKTGTGLKTYWTVHPCHREDWYWSQDILDRAPMSPGRLVLVSRHPGPSTHVTGKTGTGPKTYWTVHPCHREDWYWSQDILDRAPMSPGRLVLVPRHTGPCTHVTGKTGTGLKTYWTMHPCHREDWYWSQDILDRPPMSPGRLVLVLRHTGPCTHVSGKTGTGLKTPWTLHPCLREDWYWSQDTLDCPPMSPGRLVLVSRHTGPSTHVTGKTGTGLKTYWTVHPCLREDWYWSQDTLDPPPMSPGRLVLVPRHPGLSTHVTGKTGTGPKTYWTVHPCHREDWYWSQDILERAPMSPGRLVLVSRHTGPSTHVTGKTGTGLKTYCTVHPCHREDWYWSQDILDRAPMSPGRLVLVSRHTGPCTHVTRKTGTGLKTYWTVHPCHQEDWYWSQDILYRAPMSPGRLVLVSRHTGPCTHVTGKTGTGLKTYWTVHPCHREDWYWSQDTLDRPPMSPGRLVLVPRHPGPSTHVTGKTGTGLKTYWTVHPCHREDWYWSQDTLIARPYFLKYNINLNFVYRFRLFKHDLIQGKPSAGG